MNFFYPAGVSARLESIGVAPLTCSEVFASSGKVMK